MVLFIYGTLKRGQRNHPRLLGAEFLGEVETAPGYTIADIGPYPGLIDNPESPGVFGELWRVAADHLQRLDDFEGTPDYFVRRAVRIFSHSEHVEAYFWARTVPAGARSGQSWPFPPLRREP